MDQSVKLERPDAYCAPDAMGGGQCPINFCGQAKVGLPQNQFPQSGADSLCGVRICKVGPELVDGGRVPAGLCRCERRRAGVRRGLLAGSRRRGCAARDDSLCITAPDFPQSPFCSRDVPQRHRLPDGTRAASNARPAALADGRRPVIGMCVPESKIAGTACAARGRLRRPGRAASSTAARTSLRICRAGGTKSLGTACAAAGECRSGECFDRDFHVSGGQNRAYCSGACSVNSDCGPDQRCVRLVVGNNGSGADPLDDLVVGLLPDAVRADRRRRLPEQRGLRRAPERFGRLRPRRTGSASRARRAPGLRLHDRDGLPDGRRMQHRAPLPRAAIARRSVATPAATSGVDLCPGRQHLRAARRPRRADLGLLREVRAGGVACSRASAGYVVRIAVTPSRPAERLPGEQRDLTRASPD